MSNLRDKILEYFYRGYSEFSFSRRRQVSGYTIDIEARKGDERVGLLYDHQKDLCREKTDKDFTEEDSQRRVEDFLHENR